MRRALSVAIILSFAATLQASAVDFDQGVDVPKTLQTVRQEIREGAGQDDLKVCSQVGMDDKQIAAASTWNRCRFMGLEKNQCLYVCRDGRRITMPPASDMEPTNPRACLQAIEAPMKALQTKASPEGLQGGPAGTADSLKTCKDKCYESYKRMSDMCYEMFDCPPGLPNCLHQAAMGYNYCTKDCEKPQKP
ncbi:MAG: hypothetical protein WC728_13230 [Elusimicrobiota bacterium]